MFSRKFRGYVPLLILTLMLFYTVYRINTSITTVDDNKLYLSIILVFSGLILQAVRPRAGRRLTLVILLAGMANLLVFTPARAYFTWSLNSLHIEYNIYPFLVLILFIIINFQSIKRHIRWLFQEESPKAIEEESREKAQEESGRQV
jgi:hypothetical protein